MTLSVIIITKNSADVIGDCLKSVSFADEIIVVDAGSSDQTRNIATLAGAVIVNGSENSFSEQRTIGFKAARGKWLLYVDADERVTSSLREEIHSVISNKVRDPRTPQDDRPVAFYVKRKNFYFGNHEWPYIENIIRLFHKDALKGWKGSLHESPVIKGEIGELEGYLLHYTHQNLFSMVEKTNQWSYTEAKLRFNLKHPRMKLWRFLRVMITAFFDSYVAQGGWKVGVAGIMESIYQAFSIFITYAKLWEMQEEYTNNPIIK